MIERKGYVKRPYRRELDLGTPRERGKHGMERRRGKEGKDRGKVRETSGVSQERGKANMGGHGREKLICPSICKSWKEDLSV